MSSLTVLFHLRKSTRQSSASSTSVKASRCFEIVFFQCERWKPKYFPFYPPWIVIQDPLRPLVLV